MLRSDGAGADIFVSVGTRNVVEHVRRSRCSQFGPIFVRSCLLRLTTIHLESSGPATE